MVNFLKLDVVSAIYVTLLKKSYKFFFNNLPFQNTDPADGSIIFNIAFSKVVLPEPFLPFKIVIQPDAIDRLIFSNIFLSSLSTDKSLTIISIKI